jgi:hypothetical protein
MLIGHTAELPEELTRLSTTGLLRDNEPRLIERWIESACGAGLLGVSTDRYRTLTLTPHGREVMAARIEDVRMVVPLAVVSRVSRAKRASRTRRRQPRARRRQS